MLLKIFRNFTLVIRILHAFHVSAYICNFKFFLLSNREFLFWNNDFKKLELKIKTLIVEFCARFKKKKIFFLKLILTLWFDVINSFDIQVGRIEYLNYLEMNICGQNSTKL